MSSEDKQIQIQKLTTKQHLFILEYLSNGFNATQAAISAGYSEKTAKDIACENLAKPEIRDAIDKELDITLGNKKELLFRVIEEYKKLAFSDVKNLIKYDENGVAIYPSSEVDTSIISEVDITEKVLKSGKGTDNESGIEVAERKIRFKTHSKAKALEGLARYLGIHVTRVSIESTGKIDEFFDNLGNYREPNEKTEEST